MTQPSEFVDDDADYCTAPTTPVPEHRWVHTIDPDEGLEFRTCAQCRRQDFAEFGGWTVNRYVPTDETIELVNHTSTTPDDTTPEETT